jgi:hypothetical protein
MAQIPCTSTVSREQQGNTAPAALLADVRTGTHPADGYDRVVFDFRDTTSMPDFSVQYVTQIYQGESNNPLPMLAGSKLHVVMQRAAAHDDNGQITVPSGDLDLRPGHPRVKQVKLAEDFEAVLAFGIAVAPASQRTPFRVQVLAGNRLVIDFAHAGKSPWYCGSVFFGDRKKIDTGVHPPVTAVERRLTPPAVATAAMQELFAGPNAAERNRGLRFISSHATGFADLKVEKKIAHIRLLGPITSGGSTITIANQIMPTLRQFATVDWVKIYDEDGKTEQPDGPSDSIPGQLEP